MVGWLGFGKGGVMVLEPLEGGVVGRRGRLLEWMMMEWFWRLMCWELRRRTELSSGP